MEGEKGSAMKALVKALARAIAKLI